jgi:D-aminoacyl-tRNA deacylase
MIGLIQRVCSAAVIVEGESIGHIGRGVLLLLGVQQADDESTSLRLLERVLGYRIFPDAQGRMNLSLAAVQGELLVVPQFTLAAETRKGTRAGFSTAAAPAAGERLYEHFVARARERLGRVATGRFGAYMQISLVNDGPVTFWLEVPPPLSG